jgi:DNA anti-recombination protein RmuC
MERLSNGQVTGIPIKRIGKVYSVIGKNLEECQKNVDKFMTKFNNQRKKPNDKNQTNTN